jgi:hypothetical protein
MGTDLGCQARSHTPDFLAVTRSGVWLIDVRPASLVKDEDRESFAAAAEVAVACGWRYGVVGRWRDHISSTLDALSSQRRPLSDPLGMRPSLLATAGQGLTFGELTATSAYEPVARAQLLHLIWHRQLGVSSPTTFVEHGFSAEAPHGFSALVRILCPTMPCYEIFSSSMQSTSPGRSILDLMPSGSNYRD